jgi:hypothetical protein
MSWQLFLEVAMGVRALFDNILHNYELIKRVVSLEVYLSVDRNAP